MQEEGDIRSRLDAIVAGAGPKLTVLDYYSLNVDTGMYPLVMISTDAIAFEWESLDVGHGPMYAARFKMGIHVLCHGYKDIELEDMVSELVGGVNDVMIHRHRNFTAGEREYYWNETTPVEDVTFGFTPVKNAFVNSATLSTTLSTLDAAPPRPGS